MTDIYAACLSVSQSIDRPRATAHVLHTEDGRRTSFTMEWKLPHGIDRKSTRLNSSHMSISYAVFCLKKKIKGIQFAASTTIRLTPWHRDVAVRCTAQSFC